MRKSKKFDSVLWQKPLFPWKKTKSNVTAQKRHQNLRYTTIALQTDLRQSVRVSTATHLVWFTGLRDPNLHNNHKSCVIKKTQIEKVINNLHYKDRWQTANQCGEVIIIITQTGKVIKTVCQTYIKTSVRVAIGYASPAWKRTKVRGLKESRLTTRGDVDQGLVSSEEIWTSFVI